MASRFEPLTRHGRPVTESPNDPNPMIRRLGFTLKVGLLPPTTTLPTTAPSSITPGTASPSILSGLCAEILYEILEYLSLEDLEQLRQCQQALNTSVLAFPPYHNVRRHAPALVRAVGATRLDAFTVPQAMLEALYAERCVECQDRGTLIFLPTLERACYNCLRCKARFRMVPVSAVRRLFEELTCSQLTEIPKMLSLNGTVRTMAGQSWPRRRFWLVNTTVVFEAAARCQSTTVQHVVDAVRKRCDNLSRKSSLAASWWDAFMFGNRRAHGRFAKSGRADPAVFQSGVLRRGLDALEPAMWCAGCEYYDARLAGVFKSQPYTRNELLAHIRGCEKAKEILIWEGIALDYEVNGSDVSPAEK